eukprot:TRINITY_DN20200_c0_g1_i1.p1 TRINITY_DN20200_c0_g1~~TRINITY_DN20200_c0_g1_i1.p1  ORF type:complete len:151 (+),score=50.40 TRINITY_DN20200_c0_g1_i1:174-626(+)
MLRATRAVRGRVIKRLVSPELFCKGVPRCDVMEGKWKYVLLEVTGGKLAKNDATEYVVHQVACAKCQNTPDKLCDRECFHKDLASPCKAAIEKCKYNVWMDGGGWITVDTEAKTMHVFGVSIAMGPADHELTSKLLAEQFPDYAVTFDEE